MPKRKRSQDAEESGGGFRARKLCFTTYEAPSLQPESLTETQKRKIRYFVYQQETCPETERHHWQGYIEFHTPVRRHEAQTLIGVPNCHVEYAHGTAEQNEKYCTKEESRVPGTMPVKWGTPASAAGITHGSGNSSGGGGANAEANEVAMRILANPQVTNEEIADISPGALLRHYNSVEQMRNAQQLERGKQTMRTVYVEVIWGDPGTGKTFSVFRRFWGKLYSKNAATKWWCGYQREPVILIDEFTGGKDQLAVTEMNRIMDGYPYLVEPKGKSKPAMWNHVVIISNIHPAEWYDKWKGIPLSIQNAFMSRIRNITRMQGENRRIEKEIKPEPAIDIADLPAELRGESLERKDNDEDDSSSDITPEEDARLVQELYRTIYPDRRTAQLSTQQS